LNSLKEKTVLGIVWSAIERFGYTLIMFVSNLFLARILNPDDFGTIGMIMVFVSVAAIIVDSGFTAALIQKKIVTNDDYSTAFYVNFALGIVLYLTLYLSAPMIARFYQSHVLIDLLRIIGLILITNVFSIVQIAKLKRELNFKLLSVISFVSPLIGCSVGILMAYSSFGVWSLVFQTLITSIVRAILLSLFATWLPKFIFSYNSLKNLFRFGFMVLGYQLIDTIYTNLISLILGKLFSPKILGFYTQARTLENVPNYALTTIVDQVTFPVFSKLQDEKEYLKNGVRKTLKSMVWINFPVMVLLMLIAAPLIQLLYTDKWLECVPLFQIACIGGMMACANSLNTNIVLSLGKSKLFFFSGLYRKFLGLVVIISCLYRWGLYGLMWSGVAFAPYFYYIINVFYTNRIFNYGYIEQIKDIFPSYLLSVVCGFITFFSLRIITLHIFLQMIVYIIFYIILYVGLSKFFRFEAYNICVNEGKRFVFNKLNIK
jgi:O-antigen/teichoic acid export membrane protein